MTFDSSSERARCVEKKMLVAIRHLFPKFTSAAGNHDPYFQVSRIFYPTLRAGSSASNGSLLRQERSMFHIS